MDLFCAEYIVESVASFISVVHRFRGRPLGLPSLYLCSIVCCGMLSGGSLLMCANNLICWLLIYSRIGAVPVLCLIISHCLLAIFLGFCVSMPFQLSLAYVYLVLSLSMFGIGSTALA